MAAIPEADNPFSSLRRVDVPTLAEERAAFRKKIVGQEEAVESFVGLLVKLRSGIRSQRPAPIDAKFLAGPSGVGKTEMVYTLAEILSGGQMSKTRL